jgi:hypothetical protein
MNAPNFSWWNMIQLTALSRISFGRGGRCPITSVTRPWAKFAGLVALACRPLRRFWHYSVGRQAATTPTASGLAHTPQLDPLRCRHRNDGGRVRGLQHPSQSRRTPDVPRRGHRQHPRRRQCAEPGPTPGDGQRSAPTGHLRRWGHR